MPSKQKIKVALFSYAIDNRQAKGSAVYARRLIEELLNDTRFDFTLVHYDKVDDPIYSRAHEVIMPAPWLPSRFLRQLLFFWRYRKQKFDVIHWFQPRAYPGYNWAPAEIKVITIHGGGKYCYAPFDIPARIFDFIIRYFNRSFDAMIVGTEASRRDALNTYRVKEDQLFVTYYGGGENFKPLNKDESFEKVRNFYPQIEKSFILNISRLQPHKNIIGLIKAYDLLRRNNVCDYQLVIVGQPTDRADDIYAAARESVFSKDIIFINYIENEHLNTIYSAASVFIFPSFNEGFGLPLVEAMASGTLVVTSNFGCMSEVVGECGTLVDPYKVSNMAEKIGQLLSDDRKPLKIMCGLARAKKFVWRETAKQTAEIYTLLVTGQSFETLCPVCNEVTRQTKKECYRSRDGHFSLFTCANCEVDYWVPFKNPGGEWYGHDFRYSKINSNPFTDIKEVGKELLGSLEPGTILDVGCGSGNFLAYAKKLGWQASGIDFDQNAIKAARDFFEIEDVEVNDLVGYVEKYPNRKFNLITFFDVFEHLDNHRDFLRGIKQLTSDKGVIAFTLPYGSGSRFLLPHDFPPRHLTRWNDKNLKTFLERNGFGVLEIKKLPASISYLLMKLRFRYGRLASFNLVGYLKKKQQTNGNNPAKESSSGLSREKTTSVVVIGRLARIKDWLIFGLPTLLVWLLFLFSNNRYVGLYVKASPEDKEVG